MAFSFDTNLIIGLLSERDRLHEKSQKIFETFRSQYDETFVCFETVISETQKKLRRAINESIIKLLPVVPKLTEIDDPNSTEFQNIFLGKVNELKEKDSYRANFYDLVYKETMEFLKKGGRTRYLNSFFSELAVDLSKSVVVELRMKAPNMKSVSFEEDDREKIMEIIEVLAKAKIEFKDSMDGEIFYRVVMGSKIFTKMKFISDDEGFIDTAKKAKSIVVSSLDFQSSKLIFKTDEEVMEEFEIEND